MKLDTKLGIAEKNFLQGWVAKNLYKIDLEDYRNGVAAQYQSFKEFSQAIYNAGVSMKQVAERAFAFSCVLRRLKEREKRKKEQKDKTL